MKTTGIIRRIDNLGRIVIPKEIRDTIRIKDNESMEILIEDNKIVLKKYSLMSKIEDIASNFTDAINHFIKHNIIITDRDKIIATTSKIRKKLLNECISKQLENSINRHEQLFENHKKNLNITDNYNVNSQYIIESITCNGDIAGLIVVFDEEKEITKDEYNTISIITKILNKYLEE